MPEQHDLRWAAHTVAVDLTPKRRDADLIVTELTDETLIYDRRTQAAHCLNATTAAVWHRCDGERTVPALAAALEQERGIPADSGAVWLALDQLSTAGLLEPQAGRAGVSVSRRSLLRTVAAAGMAAVAVPSVKSITVPPAGESVSCFPNQHSCNPNNASACCSRHCCAVEDTHVCCSTG